MARRPVKLDFEKALKELESVVERMEAGELTLEESLTSFQRGIELSNLCQIALATAEQKVQILTEKDGQAEVVPFPGRDD